MANELTPTQIAEALFGKATAFSSAPIFRASLPDREPPPATKPGTTYASTDLDAAVTAASAHKPKPKTEETVER
jgi:hypothetical protein